MKSRRIVECRADDFRTNFAVEIMKLNRIVKFQNDEFGGN